MVERIFTDVRIPKSTKVIVTRFVKFSDEKNEHGPMSIAKAAQEGWLSNSSGTVSVEIKVAGGEHDGRTVFHKGDDKWFVEVCTELDI